VASNRFGEILAVTTFGESHGEMIGGVIDGFPAGFEPDFAAIQSVMQQRSPGSSPWVSPRKETDALEWISGIFEGKTTGAPIAFVVRNHGSRRSDYQHVSQIYRPGHANYSYLQKYGIFDPNGGGRASARETAVRVAAGALAEQWLDSQGVACGAALCSCGTVALPCQIPETLAQHGECMASVLQSPIFCANAVEEAHALALLSSLKESGDSTGGIVLAWAVGVPAGWGDPVYLKLEAQLASAMLSIPASKGFEIGEGFAAASMLGSVHNDCFAADDLGVHTVSNRAGGTLGGISSGAPIYLRVAFKPTSSIKLPQNTVTLSGQPVTVQLPRDTRHDPCVAIRAVPVVRSMLALVLMDAALRSRSSRS